MRFGFTSPDVKAMPSEVFNWRLLFATLSAAMAGSLFGFDTGNIGGIIVLPSFKSTFGLNVDGVNAYQSPTLSANIVSTLQAGCILGALVAGWIADRVGRRPALIGSAVLFVIGCALQLVANLGSLYAGRVLAGIATGLSSVVSPMYISESAPKQIRGSLAVCFNLVILISLTIAFWINYAVSEWKNPDDSQWRVPMGVQMVPGGLLFAGMLFQTESPRYLVTKDRYDDAAKVLERVRQLPATHKFVVTEMQEIMESVMAEKAAVAGSSMLALAKEIFTVPANRRRYLLAIMLQVFQQMTGTNAINYYAPSIFASVGVSGTSTSLLATGIYGIVKLVTTLFYVLVMVDNIGRRRPLIAGALIQACCLLYLAIFVKIAHPAAGSPTTAGGYVGVVMIYIYAFGWSFGWSPVPWLVASEVFPNRIRAVGMSTVLSFQWLLNFAITRATPYMMLNMNVWGPYLLFSLFTFTSVVWVWLCFPEFKGRSLESMDDLFERSRLIVLGHAYPTEAEKTRQGVVPSKLDEEGVMGRDSEAREIREEAARA